MKSVNKIGVAIMICAMTFSTVVFADVTPIATQASTQATAISVEKPTNVYSWEQIADLAIKKNVDFKTTEVDKMKLGRQMDDLMNNVNTLEHIGYLPFTDKKDKTDPLIDNITLLRNNRELMDENIGLKKEVLKDTVRNLFITVNKYECQLDSLTEQVKLNDQLLVVDRKKLSLGLISKFDLEKNYNAYQKVERAAESLRINIDKLYMSIKDLSGIDKTAQMVLDFSFIEQEQILPVDYQSGLVRMNSSNLKIQLLSNNAKRTKDFRAGVKERYPAGETNFEMADLDYDKSQLQLNDAVAALPYKYESAFMAITDAYANYLQKQREFDVKKLELKNTELKLSVGSSSRLELIAMKTQMKGTENDFRNARLDYISAKASLESTIKGTN